MRDLPFAKGQALGNDYLVVDAADLTNAPTARLARALCDRNRGAGSDGLCVIDLSQDAFNLEIFNPDGSAAEKSGNGLRIVAAYLHARGLVDVDQEFPVRLPTDTVRLRVIGKNDAGELDIIAEMGRADFAGSAVGLAQPEEVLGHELRLEGDDVALINTVSMGNPHCVVLVDALERADFLRRAPQLAKHRAFANGTNVQFARVAGPDTIEAWIWERGVGETLASGSSACAVAAVAMRRGLVTARELTITTPGGSVLVHVAEDYAIRLRGPAQIVYTGVVPATVVRGWEK
jgi:diaminopimelate epimerase